MKILEEVFDKINKMILDMNQESADYNIQQINLIENKLNIKLPEALKKFYARYNKNQCILTAFYIFNGLEDLIIEEDFLIIGYSNEYTVKYGIYINDLENEYINVKVAACKETFNWLDYEELSQFIVNCVVFQTINSLEASAVLDASEITLEEYFKPLYDVKSKKNKRNSYISNDSHILSIYFIDENLIYFGSTTDKILNEFEEKAEIDLDWL